MIAFGLRLTLRGGREAGVRLIVTAAAVALGVGLLLAVLAGINGVTGQDDRSAWLGSGDPSVAVGKAAPDPALASVRDDRYRGQLINRVDVAATGPRPPIPPGLTRLPGPGEYFASPAMERLLRTAPPAELADRYGGHDAGTIGDAGLPAPDTLTIVIGHTPQEMARINGPGEIRAIATGQSTHTSNGIKLILSVTAVALILPVLIFIATATRLSAARREQRFAAMRMFGATPRQVSVLSAVESTVAAVIGTALGFVLFVVLRSPLSSIPFTGERLQPADFRLTVLDVLVVALGVPIAAAVAARLTVRRVRISPLGVTRRLPAGTPRAWRVIPLLAGVAELAYFVGRRPMTTNGQLAAYLTGIVLMMCGVLVAGPWMTATGARLMAGRARRPAALIAARRLADDPRAGFRAISGLVLALFVTSAAVGVITSMIDRQGIPADEVRGPAAASTITQSFASPPAGQGQGHGAPSSIPDPVTQQLRAMPGVREVLAVHANPGFGAPPATPPIGADRAGPPLSAIEAGVVACTDLARTTGLPRCADGATVAEVPDNLAYSTPDAVGALRQHQQPRTWVSATDVTPERLASLPLISIVVTTDGSTATVEQARTVLETAFPEQQFGPGTEVEYYAARTERLGGYQQLSEVVIVTSLIIAGCTLAVSVVGGLNDRKRPFSLLRLTGVQLATLRRIVALEGAVPLLIAAIVAIGAGFLAADLFLEAQLKYPLEPPGPAYYMAVGGGLVVTAAIVISTLPFLRRITGPETARNE